MDQQSLQGARAYDLDSHVVPACRYRHNHLVEALAALRDYERGCFAATAPPTAAVDWQPALGTSSHDSAPGTPSSAATTATTRHTTSCVPSPSTSGTHASRPMRRGDVGRQPTKVKADEPSGERVPRHRPRRAPSRLRVTDRFGSLPGTQPV